MILTGSYKLDLIAVLTVLITLLYFYLKWTYTYWERRGFKTLPNASLLFGHFRDVIFQKESMGPFLTRVYRHTKEPFIGIYGVLRPMLLVNDPELIRTILIKDFSHFVDRGVYSDEKNDPLSAHMFALTGQKWKNIRAKLTPTFTSGKLKGMFSTLIDCGSNMQSYLDDLVNKGEMLDVREVAACNSINVLASVGFGIDVDTITTPNHEFRENMRKVFASDFWNGVRFFLRFIVPKLMYFLGIRLVDKEVEDFIISVVKENLEQRENGNVSRKDFFQLLVQLRNGVSVDLDDQWNTTAKTNGQKTLTLNEMAAQAFIFMAAGFETSSSTLSYCLYELAKHPEIQERVQDEIDRVIMEHDGQITYDSVSDMKLLDNCLNETLRKYPVLPMLNRTCTKEYTIPETNLVIEEGVEIFIPVLGLQTNPKYYDEPGKFNPDRWNGESGTAINKSNSYMPFGDGPRICIAMRLGKMQAKVALVLMLQKFKYGLHEKDKNSDIEFTPRNFLLLPRRGFFLQISKR